MNLASTRPGFMWAISTERVTYVDAREGRWQGVADIGLPPHAVAMSLFLFNVGVEIDGHLAAVGETTEQQFVSQCGAQGVLDETRHRPGTHEGVKAFFSQHFSDPIGKVRFHFFLVQLLFELHEKFVDDTQNGGLIE